MINEEIKKQFDDEFNFYKSFHSARGNLFHSGIDYTSDIYKMRNAYNLIDGVFYSSGYRGEIGNYIQIKHNLKYANKKIDETFISVYCHLSKIIAPYVFMPAGTNIGNIGNTGKSLTFDNEEWRPLTEKEINDPLEKRGVHLHYAIYQVGGEQNKRLKMTKMLNEILEFNKEIVFTIHPVLLQWGKIYYHPDLVYKYIEAHA